MSTRTNLYKNPSFVYNKDFDLNSALQNLKAYNVATGNVPPIEETIPVYKKNVPRKRSRERTLPMECSYQVEEKDGPMSHQDYIEKRRKEINSSKPYQELSSDVLRTSDIHLVEYDSDTSSSSEYKEKPDPHNSSFVIVTDERRPRSPISGTENKSDQVKSRSEQRFPIPDEPVCVVCGKYGEYICNETNDDICSIECKVELMGNLKLHEEQKSSQTRLDSLPEPKYASQIPEFGGDTWDYSRHCWSKKISGLCTYECWKCQRPGHLAEDCLVVVGQSKSSLIPRNLLELYKRCWKIGQSFSSLKCNACDRSSSLATCLNCENTFCDSAGHLTGHIRSHPSHQQYYSHKLKRLVKCCKSTCNVTRIKDLLVCHYCFDKAFDKFYDMCSATWKAAGLLIIWGSICCEDHFAWHRMNCLNSNVEGSAYIIRKHSPNEKGVELSDFIF